MVVQILWPACMFLSTAVTVGEYMVKMDAPANVEHMLGIPQMLNTFMATNLTASLKSTLVSSLSWQETEIVTYHARNETLCCKMRGGRHWHVANRGERQRCSKYYHQGGWLCGNVEGDSTRAAVAVGKMRVREGALQ